jgi:chorismate mutase
MQAIKWNLAIAMLLATGGNGIVAAQSAIDGLQPLVEASARRLDIAQQVAFAKWDSKTAVEDAPREAQVIMSATREGESMGLDGAYVAGFFLAQIEANKLVQYSLLADWYRAGRAPAHGRINLTTTIRPELDRLQTELVRALTVARAVRTSATCHADIARAVGKYLSAHQPDAGTYKKIALDRALAAVCTS